MPGVPAIVHGMPRAVKWRMSAPQGWNVLRLAPDPAAAEPSRDDLLALADAVREAGRPPTPAPDGPPTLRLVRPES